MKTIFSFACFITLLATSGCIVADDGGRRWHRHSAVIIGPPVIVVPAPVVEVRPPVVIVR